MKIRTFLFEGLLLVAMNSYAGGQQIILSVNYEHPSDLYGNKPRIPAMPIYVEQDDRTFNFNIGLAGETIQIFADDTLLYTDVIGLDGSVVIPDNITGEVEMRLVRGSLIYHAVIEL